MPSPGGHNGVPPQPIRTAMKIDRNRDTDSHDTLIFIADSHFFKRPFNMHSKEVMIRNATRRDAPALVALLEALFSIEDDFSVDPAKQHRGIFMMIEACGKHRCIRVAEMEGRVIGMASVQTRISTAEGGIVGFVEDVVIQEKWRGKGVGSKLLHSIDAWARQHGLLRLQLLADKKNLPALQFYRSRGWEVTELICLKNKL
jgi:N-acetylglutamate synthase-like GNAT family acetyltransferase